jgi:hypothetical protein
MEIGTAAQLRTPFGIPASVPDTDIIYKYGHTDNLIRRMGEHNNDYGRILNKEIYVEVFAHIDDSKTGEAENSIRKMFAMTNMAIEVDGRKELVTISPKNLKYIRGEFSRFGNEFSGKSEKLRIDIANMNNTITNMFNTIDFKNKEIEYLMEKNETLKEKLETLKETAADVLKSNTKISDLTILVRDMEIEKLKLEISALNLK